MTSKQELPVAWEKYAPVYDLMSHNNPSYTENMEFLKSSIADWELPPQAKIIDVGAGTGNFIEAIHPLLPTSSEIIHLDFNQAMNDLAQKKYTGSNISNVKIVSDYVQRVEFSAEYFDLIVCVHALYSMQPQELILNKLNSWLKPSGRLFVIDFGREQNWADWAWYIYKSMVKKMGPIKASKEATKFVEVAKQNHLLGKGQKGGAYPTHSTEEFAQVLRSAGFETKYIGTCYRGYSDVAVCQKVIDENVQFSSDGNSNAAVG